MRCSLCGRRRGRRDCPAIGERICAVCCGRKRMVEIDCAPDCTWLSSGVDGAAWDGRQSELRADAQRLMPVIRKLRQSQTGLFLNLVSGLVRLRRELRDLRDPALLEALEAMLKTAETERSGILYDHQPDSLHARALVSRLGALLEPAGPDGEPLPLPAADRHAVLSEIVQALRATRDEASGETAFLDTLARFEARRLSDSAQREPSRLILPD